MQKKETTHKHSLFRGTENEAVQSNSSLQSLHGSISIQPESEEGRLNRSSVLVTTNSSRIRHCHIHDVDNANLPLPVPPPAPLLQPPPPYVSSSSVLLDSSWTNSIKGFTSNVEPQDLVELVSKDCGGAPMPAAMFGAYCPPLLPEDPINCNPPLLSRHGLIMCGALIEQPAEPLVK